MAGAQLSQLAMTTTDVALVSQLQGDSLAVMAVSGACYAFFFAFGIGLLSAVSPLVSQAFGGKRPEEIDQAVAIGCKLAVAYGVLCWLFLWNIPLLFQALGYPESLSAQASDYTRLVMLGLPAFFVFLALKNYADAISRPRLPFLVAFLAIGVNALVDYGLIFGHFGWPKLGVLGAALATATVNLFMALVLFAILWKPSFTREFLRLRHPAFGEFLRLGLPAAGFITLEIALFAMAALLMGKLGTDEASAHQIVITCASTTFMIPLGMSFAGATRVGQAVGAGEWSRVRRAGLTAVALGLLCMIPSALYFMSGPQTLIDLFWRDDEASRVPEFCLELFFIGGIFQIFDGLQVTASGALRGLKDVRVPLAIAFVCYWLVGLTSAVGLAFFTPMRHLGIWTGLALGLASAAVALLWRFYHLSRPQGTPNRG